MKVREDDGVLARSLKGGRTAAERRNAEGAAQSRVAEGTVERYYEQRERGDVTGR